MDVTLIPCYLQVGHIFCVDAVTSLTAVWGIDQKSTNGVFKSKFVVYLLATC